MEEIVLSTVDFTKLYSMILTLLEKSDSSLSSLNRLNMAIKQAKLIEPEKISSDYVTMNSVVEVFFSATG